MIGYIEPRLSLCEHGRRSSLCSNNIPPNTEKRWNNPPRPQGTTLFVGRRDNLLTTIEVRRRIIESLIVFRSNRGRVRRPRLLSLFLTHARIQYMEIKLTETESVFVFRDIDENSKYIFNYQQCIDLGKNGYTEKGLAEVREFFGVYVLRTNSGLPPKEVFCAYKGRCGIETFYNYIKNAGDFNNLKEEDYVKQQGLAFIILITGQLYARLNNAVKALGNNTISTQDILNMARCLKMDRKGNTWTCRNKRTKDLEILKKLGFIPLNVYNEGATG